MFGLTVDSWSKLKGYRLTTMIQAPNRLPWPPMILIATVVAAWALNTVAPISFANTALNTTALYWFGTAVVGIALSLDVAAMLTMYRARTNILPHRAAGKLVTTGPFAFSRNPIYLGNTLVLMGLGLRWSNAWLLLLAIIPTFAVTQLAIRREEQHLEALFGEDYRHYTDQVQRWIGWKSKT